MSNKKSRKNIPVALRTAVWDRYIGPGVQSKLCDLCGIYELKKSTNNGWECCHQVADTFSTNINIFYLFPGCTQCNSEMQTLCVYDFLFVRGRHTHLRKLIWKVFTMFSEQHSDEMHYYNNSCWKVINHLYGERFVSGGGIVNTQIYEICKSEQYKQLAVKAADLTDELKKNAQLMGEILEDKIVISKPRFV